MAVTALQSEAEWLSDILAALGFSGGGVTPGSGSKVQGTAADGAAAVGNPVQTGGVDGSGNAQAFLTDTDGRMQVVQRVSSVIGDATTTGGSGFIDSTGATRSLAAVAFGFNGTTYDRTRTANGASNTTGTGLLGVGGLLFDETNWQPPRGNTDATVLASGSRTTTQTITFTNYNSSYLRVVLDMTTVGTGSVTVSIDAQDAISGKWVTLLTGTAITTNSTNVYRVGPGLTAVANATANDFLSRNMRIVVTANNANAAVYSVGRQLTGV